MLFYQTVTRNQPVSRAIYKNVLSIEFSVLTVLENNCFDDTITRHCVPCSLFLDKIYGQLKVCEKNGTQINCSCSAGWKDPTCVSSRSEYGLSTYVKLFGF
jgi:hypothetical protein